MTYIPFVYFHTFNMVNPMKSFIFPDDIPIFYLCSNWNAQKSPMFPGVFCWNSIFHLFRLPGTASSWPWPQRMPTWPPPTPWPWPERRKQFRCGRSIAKSPKKKNIGNPWKSIQIYGDPHVIPLYFYIFPDMSSSLLVAIGQVDPKGERTLGVLTKTVGIPAALSTRESGFRLWWNTLLILYTNQHTLV